jgi:hypothetical protein
MEMLNSAVFKRGWVKILAGFIAGTVLSGTAAFSFTVNNTPAGGYLLCYNTKTTSVTFPGKLSCPNGTKALEVAGVNGAKATNPSTSDVASSPAPTQKNIKCSLAYLQKPGVNITDGVATCKGSEINNLMNEVQLAIEAANSTNPNDSMANIATQKTLMAIMTSLIAEIQKKIKG